MTAVQTAEAVDGEIADADDDDDAASTETTRVSVEASDDVVRSRFFGGRFVGVTSSRSSIFTDTKWNEKRATSYDSRNGNTVKHNINNVHRLFSHHIQIQISKAN